MGASALEVGQHQRIQLGVERLGTGDRGLCGLAGTDLTPGDRIGEPDGVEPRELVRCEDMHKADTHNR